VAQAILSRALKSGRIAHAYLFHGPAGIGKRTAAKRFAAAIQCERCRAPDALGQHPGLVPCGECDACRRVAAGTHPEVLEIEPDTASGQNISVKQAGAVVANVALRPKAGARRLFLIGSAELLHEDAANALLKTLEEPSPFATLILCAPNPGLLLPTIRSRCQPVRFDPVPVAEIAAALVARHGLPAPEAERIARAADGLPGAALSALGDPQFAARREQILAVFDRALRARARCSAEPSAMVLSLGLADELREAAQAERKRAEANGAARPVKGYLAQMLGLGRDYLRDILVLGAGGPPAVLHHGDRTAELAARARELDAVTTLSLIELLGETMQILERNVPPQMALERLFCNFLTTPRAVA